MDKKLLNMSIDLRRKLHENPEVSGKEVITKKY